MSEKYQGVKVHCEKKKEREILNMNPFDIISDLWIGEISFFVNKSIKTQSQ